eukprot:m.167795 g.167795  ORF g.167795 m.167795 type:complete len:320 (+) comp14467_c0_seq7:2321-3280(+)
MAAQQKQTTAPPKSHCRFYKQRFPEAEDVVMVNVTEIAEMGAYVKLLEYDNIPGMILLSELSRRRIRSINKLVRVGRNECVVVLRVDGDKGYIDLSKRRVQPEEVAECEDKYNQAKIINTILRNVADSCSYPLEELYEKTAWLLEEQYGGPGSSYKGFKKIMMDNPERFQEFDIPDEVRAKLEEKIRHKLMPTATKIRSEIEVTCYAYEGIDAVKAALKQGLAQSTDQYPIEINLIAPPQYKVETTALDHGKGIAKLEAAIEAIKQVIEQKGGSLVVKTEPRAVTVDDDLDLLKRLEDLGRVNEEVAGDDDSEDEASTA